MYFATNPPKRAPLQTRVGIATGLVVVGDLTGSGVGETPNLAGRREGGTGGAGARWWRGWASRPSLASRRTRTCSGTPAAFSLRTRAPTRALCKRTSAIETSSTCATPNCRPRASRTSGATDADCPIFAKKVVGTRAEGPQDGFWAAVLTWRWRKSTSVRSTSTKLAPPS
jgi:hypothetical protein